MMTMLKKMIPYYAGIRIKNLIRWAVSLLLYGNQYACPFCSGTFRKFLSGGEDLPFFKEHHIIGGGRRANMLCPRCHSTDRDRLIFSYLISNPSFQAKQQSLLHLAPEKPLKEFLKRTANIVYVSGDKFEQGYRDFYYDRDTVQLDLTSLPYPDHSFDIVICNHVLEHIEDESKALGEIYRVLKSDGWAILQVPIAAELAVTLDGKTRSAQQRKSLFGQADHVRLYGLDYAQRLRSKGFVVNMWSVEQDVPDSEFKKYALNREEKVYIASKSLLN